MNSELLKRIVRAIGDGSQRDLELLAEKVVESERRVGHNKLASQLESILEKSQSAKKRHAPLIDSERGMKQLPLSKRHGELLATVIPHDALEHHMVLPAPVEERFARIEREYAARERLGVYGLKNRKTILLYGPPGCGKSLGAKRLAWNTGLQLIKVRFDALLSSYFGESAANLRNVFDMAKERPCVLLLDECDFIARSRTTRNDIGEASRIVNSLLQLMEEYEAPGLLVATTNLESSLDDALFRRFDEVLQVPLPGRNEIDKLLRMTLSAVTLANKISWKRVIDQLVGSSAAMTVKAAQDAAKAAVLSGEKVVTEALLLNAVKELKRIDSEGILK
ncbi:AAA family ATPase [Gimesia maris]|uniref:AAA family ATPase n=1 Tax=Gimesia maris TaxID=122 RepID=UPI0032EDB26C